VRPYDILSPRAKNARRSRARRSRGFLQLAPSRITDEKDSGPFFFPGRISSKGPASMRDASDLHLILHCCPRFTSEASKPSTYRSFYHYVPSTQRLLYTCLLFFLLGWFSPTSTWWHVFLMRSYCRSFMFCCDERYNQKGCQNLWNLIATFIYKCT